MTNLPAALRARLAGEVPLSALDPAHEAHAPTAREGAVPHRRRPPDRGGAHALPRRPPLALPVQPVRLPADLHVLRHRPDESAQPHRVRRSSTRRCTSAASRGSITSVFMGMGEPLMNLDNVLAACERLPDWRHPRRTAISTVGWIPGIERLTPRAHGPARALAARRRGGAALRADAGERPLRARRRARRVPRRTRPASAARCSWST